MSRVLNAVPPEEMEGLHLTGPSWEVPGKHLDHSAFLRSLPVLVGTDAVLFLEGGAHPSDIKQFLKSHCVDGPKIARGTIWPRAEIFHVPARADVLQDLADLADHCASPELCNHLHVYRQDVVLLEWHDAFADPFFVSKKVPLQNLQSFCETLSLTYQDGIVAS
jgi:hypothetical protein